LSATDVAPGEVLAVTQFSHPERGTVHCPAALLVAAESARAGLQVRSGVAVEAPGWAAVLFTSCYIKDGVATGIGAAACAADRAAVAAARDAVQAWTAALRTRRVLCAASDPLCPGAHRAIGMAQRAVASSGSCYVYGELPGYADERVTRVTDLSALPAGSHVVFPAHGVPLAIAAEAAARGLRVTDATCPLVATAQRAVRGYAADGDTVVILAGRHGQAVRDALAGQAPERAAFAESESDLAALDITGKVSYVLQPGVPVEQLTPVATALKARHPARGASPDGWCYAASDRLATVRAVAADSQVLLIVGAQGTPEAVQLAALAPGAAYVIDDVAQLRPEWIAEASTVGLAETLTAPPGAVQQVLAALSGLGPVSLAERRQVTSTVPAQVRAAMAALR
jgi:4-hydroxy-3-methylbut-2-enyl diphosphate reductase